jgi:hypothetical protein
MSRTRRWSAAEVSSSFPFSADARSASRATAPPRVLAISRG